MIMAKELTEKEFIEGLKAAKLDIKTAADCLTDVMQYVAIQDPQNNTEETRNCLFWIALAREKLSDICNNLEKLER